ncbi:MAG TPA: hypothetical protein VE988_15455, partial [Gemmataceae bacterium]|nr:hypothetical protein [Gemmataceae bacterium]
MSTFYILPPRPLVGQQVIHFLQSWFPGLSWDSVNRAELAETFSAAACKSPGAYVVFREDLPEGVEIPQALQSDFGAEPGDEVVEVATGSVR